MVRIVNYLKRQTEEGKEFFVLEMPGSVVKQDCKPYDYVNNDTGDVNSGTFMFKKKLPSLMKRNLSKDYSQKKLVYPIMIVPYIGEYQKWTDFIF